MSPIKLTQRARTRAIAMVVEARFSVRDFEALRRENAEYWDSPRNDMARGIYGEAMREKERLSHVTDAQLVAEFAAVRP